MSGGGGELFRISLGPAANAVTSHLCNLEGLACTGITAENDLPLCDPNISHTVCSEQYVPRVLFVDGRDCFDPWNNNDISDIGFAWKGKVETYIPGHEFSIDASPISDAGRQFASSDTRLAAMTDETRHVHGPNADLTLSSNQMKNPNLYSFQTAVLELQSRPHSRHRVSKHTQQVSSQFVYTASQHKRHVEWDSNEEEEEEETDHDDDGYTRRHKTLNYAKHDSSWRESNQITRNMDESWDAFMESSSIITNSNNNSLAISHDNKSIQTESQNIPWMSYFMPPHPPTRLYSAPLPMDCNKTFDDTSHLHSYHMGYGSSSMNPLHESHWHEQVLGEALRRNMESCDAIRGFQVMVDDDLGIFGGIACHTLQLLEDECKSAAKFVIPITDGNQFSPIPTHSSSQRSTTDDSWRSEQQVRQSIRSHINSCMNLYGASQYSNLVLPLSLNSCIIQDFPNMSPASSNVPTKSLFIAAAHAAMSLEAGTLSYRLHGKSPNRCMTGLLNRYFDGSGQGDDWYSSTPKLTFHEFVASLKPTNRHCIIELSSLLRPSEPQDLQKHFFHGTSIDRQIKEMKGLRGFIDTSREQPGEWLDDYSMKDGGILSSLTPMIHPPLSKRSLHRNFTLCSTFRGALYNTSPLSHPLRNHTSALMEAMCIRYRPQSCVGTVVNQSLFELANTGPASAAGSYWKGLLKRDGRLNTPEISVFSNSTRIYPYLHKTITGMSDALSRKNYGYVTQDIMSAILPERDDCKEALESCLDLREMYEPPPGSGLLIDEEGTYFDDNE